MLWLFSDSAYVLIVLKGTYHPGGIIDYGWLLMYALWGAGMLHPSVAVFAEPAPFHPMRLTRVRITLLAAATLLSPGVFIIQYLRHKPVDIPVIVGGTAALSLLSLIRLGGLLDTLRKTLSRLNRAIEREKILRKSAAGLSAAADVVGIRAVALEAARALTGDVPCYITATIDSAPDPRAQITGGSCTGGETEGETFFVPLISAGKLQGSISASADSPIPKEIRRGLEALGAQVSLALERTELIEEVYHHRTRRQLEYLVENVSDVIALLQTNGEPSYMSPSVKRILDYESAELTGTSLLSLVHPDDRIRAQRFFVRVFRTPGTSLLLEVRVRHSDGSFRHLEILASNLLSKPEVRGVVINARDISERKKAEARLAYQAFHDPLTGLPNRVLFKDRLERALARRRERLAAVLYLDLDGFKNINDSLGHAAGDRLLVEVARRFLSCVRPGDTVARFGGDEFTILLENISRKSDAEEVAGRIIRELSEPFRVEGHLLFVTASIGVALSSGADGRSEDLLRAADVALYRAKSEEKACYKVFDKSKDAHALERLKLENDLRGAIERNELRVYYQPVLSLELGTIAGMEALLRWEHPERGMLSPAEFIPLAEESGLIVPIGKWVLEEACRQGREWQERHAGDAAPIAGVNTPIVGVNLSLRQFQNPSLVEDVAKIRRESGLNPANLSLEITESVAMHDVESTIATLEKLKSLGVWLVIDDFGTGNSSISYLTSRFKMDHLKIDGSFVREFLDDPDNSKIIPALIEFAHTLSFRVIAEGVESIEQLEHLKGMGCEFVQGYHIARPLPPAEASELLRGKTLSSI